jgi:hypothetical protein
MALERGIGGARQIRTASRIGHRGGDEAMSRAAMLVRKQTAAAAQARSETKAGPESGNIRIGEVDDAFEREADRLADQIVANGDVGRPAFSFADLSVYPTLQRKCACGGDGECEECEKKVLRKKASGNQRWSQAPAAVHSVLRKPGRPLDTSLRAQLEPRLGFDFSKVRIHTDFQASASAQAVSARAYTVGYDIVFGAAQYLPDTIEGRRLIAHELVHVIQQSSTGASGLMRVPVQTLQRVCVSGVSCPPAAVELPAGWPWSEAAEICIRTDYTRQHAGNLIGNNNTWRFMIMPVGTPAKRDHDCFKDSLMAKSGMFLAQPDIIDFTSAEIYDVTTQSQIQSHRVRVDADTKEATALASLVGCGGSAPPTGRTWSPGVWSPPSGCYWIGGDIYLRAENVGSGLLIYHVLKDVKKELITVTLLATLAALLKSGSKGQVAGRVGARAFAYANLAAIAILLASGKAEAKPGPGDEMPIETLFKAMAQKGSPVPKELQDSVKAYLDANPDLKKKVEDAASKGGDMTDAQKEISDRALKIVSEHPEEFTQQDLELMLAANDASGSTMPAADLTAAKLRAVLDARKKQEAAQGSGSGKGASPDSPTQQKDLSDKPGEKSGDKPAEGDKPAKPLEGTQTPTQGGADAPGGDASKLSSLSKASRDKMAAAPANVRSLFFALTEGSGTGPAVTDAAVDKYLSIVPSSLTTEEAQKLVSQLSDVQGRTADQILDRLKAAVDELAKKQLDAAAAAGDLQTTGGTSGTTIDPQLLEKLADLARKSNFKGMSKGEVMLSWSPKDVKDDVIHGIIKYNGKDGTQGVAWATAHVETRDARKAIRTVKVASSTPLVSASKKVVAPSSQLVGLLATTVSARR